VDKKPIEIKELSSTSGGLEAYDLTRMDLPYFLSKEKLGTFFSKYLYNTEQKV